MLVRNWNMPAVALMAATLATGIGIAAPVPLRPPHSIRFDRHGIVHHPNPGLPRFRTDLDAMPADLDGDRNNMDTIDLDTPPVVQVSLPSGKDVPSSAKSRTAKKPPEKTYMVYDGTVTAPNAPGLYADVKSTDILSAVAKGKFLSAADLAPIADAEREWLAHADDPLPRGERRSPEPAISMIGGNDPSVDLKRAFVRHVASPKPAWWQETVERISALPTEAARTAAVNDAVNGAWHYYNRVHDSRGIARKSGRWFGEWSMGPEEAARLGFGDCRDYATGKLLLLADIGKPLDKMAELVILPAPHQNAAGEWHTVDDESHVVLAVVDDEGKTSVLDQVHRENGQTLFPVEDARYSMARRGVLAVVGWATSAWYGPAAPLPSKSDGGIGTP